jgi:hypothetical protein
MSTAKLCVDCKHAERHRGMWCMAPRPGKVNLVYGGPVPIRSLCDTARAYAAPCGPEGALFEARPPKRSFWDWFSDTFGDDGGLS